MEYLQTEAERQATNGMRPHPYWPVCKDCKRPFTFLGEGRTVYTMAGARECQISGICEACFDGLFKELK